MQPYIHHAWIFEQTGTTFAFLFFGSAAVVWALLTLQSYFGNEHIKTSKVGDHGGYARQSPPCADTYFPLSTIL
eukprot:1394688-Amorphochlora_amoeboformis.AAC.1